MRNPKASALFFYPERIPGGRGGCSTPTSAGAAGISRCSCRAMFFPNSLSPRSSSRSCEVETAFEHQ